MSSFFNSFSLRSALIALAAFLVFPLLAFADETLTLSPLTAIPGTQAVAGTDTLTTFLNMLYRICIGLAAILAVIQITRAGIVYMLQDSITERKEARHLINMSLFGLVLVLTPTVVFGIIDPRILSLKIGTEGLGFEEAPPLGDIGSLQVGLTEEFFEEVQGAASSCGITGTGRLFFTGNELFCMRDTVHNAHSEAASCIGGGEDAEDEDKVRGCLAAAKGAYASALQECKEGVTETQATCTANALVPSITSGAAVSSCSEYQFTDGQATGGYASCCLAQGYYLSRSPVSGSGMCLFNQPAATETEYDYTFDAGKYYILAANLEHPGHPDCVYAQVGEYSTDAACQAVLTGLTETDDFIINYACETFTQEVSLNFNDEVCEDVGTIGD